MRKELDFRTEAANLQKAYEGIVKQSGASGCETMDGPSFPESYFHSLIPPCVSLPHTDWLAG